MANTKGLLIAATTVVVAVGVYFGLNLVRPHVEEKGEMPQVASADQVFSGTIQETGKLEAPPPPPVTGAPPPEQVAPAPEQNTQTASASPSSEPAAEAPTPSAPAEAAPPPAEPAKPAEPEPAKPQEQAAAPAATPEPAPEPTPAAPEPAPSDDKMMVPEPAAQKPARKSTPPRRAAPSPVADARWWSDASKDPNHLNLTFAGQAAGEKSIALLFSGAFNKAGVANTIKVADGNGKPANGHWEVATNPKMLLYRGVGAGRYTVTLAPELADASGKKLGRKLSGPVTVQ